METKKQNTTPLIFNQLLSVLKDIKAVVKSQKDGETFATRNIDDIYNALHPLFQKHGVFVTTEVLSQDTESRAAAGRIILNVKFTFYAVDGSSVSSITKGEASDRSGENRMSAAISSAFKSELIRMFLIPTVASAAPAAKAVTSQPAKIVTPPPARVSPPPAKAVTPPPAKAVKKVQLTASQFKKAIARLEKGETLVHDRVFAEFLISAEQKKAFDNAKKKGLSCGTAFAGGVATIKKV